MAKPKQKPAADFQLPQGALHSIPLAYIIPSPTNPRKNFNEEQLQELATSIKQVGIMQPIVVHVSEGDGYDLISGERRYRAAMIAGLEEIPAMVYPRLPDHVVFELQITENLQRADINPMEESDAFHELTRRGMTTADDIAKRLGKSTKYVYDRLSLQRCILDVQDMIRSGQLPIAHAKQFAKLNMDDQQQLFDALAKGAPVALSDLKRKIDEQFSFVLDQAPFNIKSPNLVPKAGSCTTCPKRSGCNQLLFDDVSSKDICFDRACYDNKVQAHIEKEIAELQAAGMTVHRVAASYGTEIEGVLTRSDWEEVTPEDDEYEDCKTVGVIVDVPTWSPTYKIGQVVKIEVNQDKDEDEDDDDDLIDNDEGTAYKPTKPARSHDHSIDHETELLKKTIHVIASKHLQGEKGLPGIENFNFLKKVFYDNFYAMTSDSAEHLCEAMGWPKMYDDEGDFEQVKTGRHLSETLDIDQHLVWLVYCINEAENAIIIHDEDEAMASAEEVAYAGISIQGICDQYEQETGYKHRN